MIPRHVETLFCDDIRHEVSGKVSFIGVYSGALFAPNFPITLPKLCLSVKVVTPVNEPLRALTLRVFRDEETLQEITLDEAQLAEASDMAEEMPEDKRSGRVQMAQLMLAFSPIRFDTPCKLRVRVQTEDGELSGMALKIERTPASNNASK